ncbi:hypothetical protein DYBT9275_01178 [Dyadobacter sp. CECT 9275]|uniref:HlyD family secretion protein n=1 Tax=Dyadobacter helix TaxID=2822344 RepID=A0A916N356_9BACT|nr:HlyD family efflux transporter periplasmic adaptor subunit [Dyadobacter sp. CECT 9275]CAG4993484.1 hypothetical protein DYBT9275_01178 [Dyadobacter sp. CECT 9275]
MKNKYLKHSGKCAGTWLVALILGTGLVSCNEKESTYDASGVFEAEETIISAEATGVITWLELEEGQMLPAGKEVGVIDTTQLYLRKKQLQAQYNAIGGKTPQIAKQTAAYKKQMALTESQINTLLIEKKRIENLLKVDAATPKQLDDINGQLDVLTKQLEVIRNQDIAQTSVLSTQTKSILSEGLPLQVQIEQVEDQLEKCHIINPVTGTVLSKYLEANEMAVPGKPIYKIADLSTLILRAYIAGNQLPQVRLNQKVKVLTDSGKGEYQTREGIVTWISSKAEFTPKTIQTKDERANMVYAVKVLVKNDGYLKIGMYGEIKF